MTGLYVFVGGGIGSMLRYLMGLLIQRLGWTAMPYATFLVNIVGSFLIGYLAATVATTQQENSSSKWFWMVGFCGGFTTFSSFSLETLNLVKQGNTATAMGYVFLTNLICLLFVWVGYQCHQNVFK